MPADLIPARGAIPEPLLLEVERELSAADLPRLAGAPKVSVSIIKRVSASHHRMAALLASGKSLGEIAAIVGCTTQRLVQLQVDPMFTELVSYYRDQQMALMMTDAARLADKIVDLGEMAVDELRERMEDENLRKNMRVGDVRQIAEFAMDRTVAPPKQVSPAATPPAAITINFGTPVRQPPQPVTINAEIENEKKD